MMGDGDEPLFQVEGCGHKISHVSSHDSSYINHLYRYRTECYATGREIRTLRTKRIEAMNVMATSGENVSTLGYNIRNM